MKVQDPSGQTWRVTRRWVPWRPRLREPGGGDLDLVSAAEGPISFVVLLLLGLFVVPVVMVGVVFVGELLLLLLPFAVLGRMLFGQHWWVEAREGFAPRWEAEAGTWQEAGALIRRTASSIANGDGPLPNLGPDRDLAA